MARKKKYVKEKVAAYNLSENIKETGWLNYENVGAELIDCSIGLVTNTNIEMNTLAGPANKFFNYLTYGIACISVDLPETTTLLNETKSGITIQNRSIENLVSSIKHLLDSPAELKRYCENAFQAYQQYNWSTEEQKLLSFYKNVVLNNTGIHYR